MKKILELFKHDVIRDYKDGKEIRTKNLDEALNKARSLIEKENLNIEVFDVDAGLKSFSIREIK